MYSGFCFIHKYSLLWNCENRSTLQTFLDHSTVKTTANFFFFTRVKHMKTNIRLLALFWRLHVPSIIYYFSFPLHPQSAQDTLHQKKHFFLLLSFPLNLFFLLVLFFSPCLGPHPQSVDCTTHYFTSNKIFFLPFFYFFPFLLLLLLLLSSFFCFFTMFRGLSVFKYFFLFFLFFFFFL